MLKIRMKRVGRRNQPAFRLVVVDSRTSAKSGRAVEEVGFYNPRSKERGLKKDRIEYWLSQGAQASGTVYNMLVDEKVVTGPKRRVTGRIETPAADADVKQESAPATEEVAPEAPKAAEAGESETPAEPVSQEIAQ